MTSLVDDVVSGSTARVSSCYLRAKDSSRNLKNRGIVFKSKSSVLNKPSITLCSRVLV